MVQGDPERAFGHPCGSVVTTIQQTAPSAGVKLRPLRVMTIFLLTGLILATIPFAKHTGLYILVCLLSLCVIGPLWYSRSRKRLDYFESIHVFGIIYFLYMGVGAIWTVNDPGTVAYDLYIVPYVPRALLYCLLGYVALLVGYYGPWRRRELPPQRPEMLRGPLFLLLTGGIGLAGYVASGMSERIMALGLKMPALVGSMSQLAPVFLFSWALGWMLYFSNTATRGQLWTLFGALVPGAFIVAFSTFSDKSLIMVLVGLPVIARWYTRRKIPWVFLVSLLLIFLFVIFPVYNTYRWSNPMEGKVTRMVSTMQTMQSWDSTTYWTYTLQNFKRRMALINSVAVVVRDTGRWVPYARGSTILMPTLVYFIPRIVWHDKPVAAGGREFGRIFRVTNPLTRDTYIAPTVIGELYWNFDLPGVLVGMAILGMAMRILYRRYAESETFDPVRKAVHILVLVLLAHIGGSMAPMIVGFVRALLLLAVLRWMGRRTGLLVRGPLPAGPAAPIAAGSR